jgi:hypothetical protein
MAAKEAITMSTIYVGQRDEDGCRVLRNGRPLPTFTALRNHSPTGFEWGYGGGPAQLALALCYDATGHDRERTFAVYQQFKARVVVSMLRDEWRLTGEEVLGTIERLEQEQRVRRPIDGLVGVALLVLVATAAACSSGVVGVQVDAGGVVDQRAAGDLVATAADLEPVATPDLLELPDLVAAPDLTRAPDLLELPDLTPAADLVALPDLTPSCGAGGQACCPGDTCNAGVLCRGHMCEEHCGQAGQPACYEACAPGLLPLAHQVGLCDNTPPVCTEPHGGCGDQGDHCCDDNGQPTTDNGGACPVGLQCKAGRCYPC